jgi:CRP/FNR family transcriptional regulator, cyclic AMP receptor protein
MTPQCQFKKGDVLFHQGHASDRVLRVRHGEIEVLREVGATSLLLGHVRDGEWLGEMGVIEHRNRSATARAATDSTVEVLTAQQFLDRVSSDPTLARDLILRLSIRLKRLEDKMAGDLLPFAHERLPEAPDGTASNAVLAHTAPLSIAAQTDALRARMGAAPIHISHVPFVIGRMPVGDEAPPPRLPDLRLDDEEPFRLSRDHFMIMRRGDWFLVSDLGSTLGTIVNGQGIGYHFMRDAVPLQVGENRIIAGGWGSPFEFVVSVSPNE